MKPSIEYVRVGRDEFAALGRAKVVGLSKSAFHRAWKALNAALREGLAARWTEDGFCNADFAISDDWSMVWSQSGGIHSRRICCPAYVRIIRSALANSADPDRWAYHSSVDISTDKLGDLPKQYLCTAFVITATQVILPDNGVDFSCFGAPRARRRR